MTYLTLTQIRNARLRADVRSECRRAEQSGRRLSYGQALRRVLHRPVSQGYFVSVDHALPMVRRAISGKLPAWLSPMRRQMWLEITDKVIARRHATGCTAVDAIAHVLQSSTASRYFLSPATAQKILYHEL